jgi:hypothetical protein
MTRPDFAVIAQHAEKFFTPRTKREREQLRDEWITYAMNVWGITQGEAHDIAIATLKMLDNAVIQLTEQCETKIKLTQPVMPGFE